MLRRPLTTFPLLYCAFATAGCVLVGAFTAAAVHAAESAPPPAASSEVEAGEAPTHLPETVVPFEPARRTNMLQRAWSWSDAQLRGVFDFILPDTQDRHTWKLSVQPHFRDFLSKDHIRLPVAVRYGFNRRAEGELEVEPYFANPWGDERGNGVANYRANFKYRWSPGLDPTVSAATGLQIERPNPSSPADLNDGVNRYRLFFTFARPSPTIPNLEAFLNLSYDLITPSRALGVIDEEDPQDDFVEVGSGLLYRRKRFTYGVSLAYARTVDGHRTSFVTLKPSLIYDVPARFAFNSPGQWQIGGSVEGKRYGNETAVSVGVRVRWQVDFKRMIRDWRNGIAQRNGRDRAK